MKGSYANLYLVQDQAHSMSLDGGYLDRLCSRISTFCNIFATSYRLLPSVRCMTDDLHHALQLSSQYFASFSARTNRERSGPKKTEPNRSSPRSSPKPTRSVRQDYCQETCGRFWFGPRCISTLSRRSVFSWIQPMSNVDHGIL